MRDNARRRVFTVGGDSDRDNLFQRSVEHPRKIARKIDVFGELPRRGPARDQIAQPVWRMRAWNHRAGGWLPPQVYISTYTERLRSKVAMLVPARTRAA